MYKKYKRAASRSRGLRLSKQTVRSLSKDELALAAGANGPKKELSRRCGTTGNPLHCVDDPGGRG